jgi:hypothetical protein
LELVCITESPVIDFRNGSLADIEGRPTNVRFTPKSGHRKTLLGCPLCAKSGHGTARWTVSPLGRDADFL